MKKKFSIEVTYFKASGKMYIKDTFELEASPCGIYETCYMQDIVDYFKQLRKDNLKMPGLSHCWREYIVVNCDTGYPQLITPE